MARFSLISRLFGTLIGAAFRLIRKFFDTFLINLILNHPIIGTYRRSQIDWVCGFIGLQVSSLIRLGYFFSSDWSNSAQKTLQKSDIATTDAGVEITPACTQIIFKSIYKPIPRVYEVYSSK